MHDAERLRTLLVRHRLEVKGGTSHFLLADNCDALSIHRSLAERGIWTRAFANEPTWLRFELPPEEGFARVDKALSGIR